VEVGGQSRGEVWIKLPNKLRQIVKFAGGQVVYIYNGIQGWVEVGGRMRDLPAQALTELREAIELDSLLLLWNIARPEYKFEIVGTAQVDGQETQILRMTTDQGKSADFYFDTERFVPLKIVTQTSEGKTKEQLLSDYRRVEGFWVPFALKTLEDKELTDNVEVVEFKVNTGVGDEQFEKP
jgi:outer membrane lipoprotein-sorting protein